MEKSASKNGVSARAYKGDAMTFLAFDLDESLLENCVGFSIHVRANKVDEKYEIDYFLYNRLTFSEEILENNQIGEKEKLSSEFSPFQKFNWVHVPSTDHNISQPYFGKYKYSITPRYLVNGLLEKLDKSKTVSVTIDVSPFKQDGVQLGFARAFISSQAYVRRFGMNNQTRPDDGKLLFNIKDISGTVQRRNERTKLEDVDYTYEEQHKYLGWQARERVFEFLDEVIADTSLSLDVFAYDLNEPVIVDKLIKLAKKGRVRIILDNSGDHGVANKYEGQFETLFNDEAKNKSDLVRGCYKALSHSKVFIQKKGGKAFKVLTGSTNFSTNGLYVNANHVVIFDNKKVAQLYADVFENSFGQNLMDVFRDTEWAINDFVIAETKMPDMTIRYSPHTRTIAQKFFSTISERIRGAKSDVLFAIMKDRSASSILEAVRDQVKNEKIFSYGITDTISSTKDEVMLYKPNSKRGIRVAGRGSNVQNVLPPPFDTVPKIDGYSVHHKFVVVDFKGKKPVVYCGSSNLAFTPEQKNGDNLIEIRDKDIVTAFAIEALRLVDHFHWRNKELSDDEMNLDNLEDSKKIWYKKYYDPEDLRSKERELFIIEEKK